MGTKISAKQKAAQTFVDRHKEGKLGKYEVRKNKKGEEIHVVSSFSDPDDQKITTSYVREIRTYMLSAKVEDGLVQFYFKHRPSKPDWSGAGPLDIIILNNCEIRITLDPNLHWSFRHDFTVEEDPNSYLNDAITLGAFGSQYTYHNLRHLSDREVIFCADVQDPTETIEIPVLAEIVDGFPIFVDEPVSIQRLRDQFNIYVELDQLTAEMIPETKLRYSKRLVIKIDPDIQNPGDNTQTGGKSLDILVAQLIKENEDKEELVSLFKIALEEVLSESRKPSSKRNNKRVRTRRRS